MSVTRRKPEPTAADRPAPNHDATDESAGRHRKRTATRTSVGLIAVGALIVAIHLGIALAVLARTGWAANTILVVVLVMLAFIGGHLALARHRPGRR